MKAIATLLTVLVLASVVSSYELHFFNTFFGRERETTSPGYIHRDVDARATTQQSTTTLDPRFGVLYDERYFCEEGPEAFWHTSFVQVDQLYNYTGHITFANGGHRLFFTVVSFGRIDQWHNLRHGAGYANITDGEGHFKGADGRLSWTSTHDVVNDHWVAHVTASVWVADPRAAVNPFGHSKPTIGL